MNWIRRRSIAVTVTALGLSAMLGGSLGMVAAANRNLSAGFNIVGGPLSASMAPAVYLECLDDDEWAALYIWDGANQKWLHFFNPADVPAYVNSEAANGIVTVPRATGVVLMMKTAVAGAQLKDGPSESCS